jgi:hypothetical protein
MKITLTRQKEDRRRLMYYVLLLLFFALGLRLLYANNVLKDFAVLSAADRTSYEKGYLTPDSLEYLELAVDFMKGHFAQAISLTRTVGYPAFLALLGANPTAILYVQALLLSLIPVCTFLLVGVLTENALLGFAAGLVSSISPTGVALGSLVMSDALFASLFAVLFTAMVYGILRDSLPWVLFSAIVSGLAILVRPILLFWPAVAVIVSALIAGFPNGTRNSSRGKLQVGKSLRTQMLLLFFVPTVFAISMAGANYVKNGIFTVSVIGKQTLRVYLAARTDEWGIAGHLPSFDAVKQNQNILRERLGTMTVQEQANAYLPESIAIFQKYPTKMLKAFVKDAQENTVGGWDYFSWQLATSRHQLFFSRVSKLESWLRNIALFVTFFAPFIALFAVRINPSPNARRLVSILFAMTITFLYFVILSGLTFWTGPRIIYPVEILQISTAAILMTVLLGAFGPSARLAPDAVDRV